MIEKGFNIGGEQSGHVILLDHATTVTAFDGSCFASCSFSQWTTIILCYRIIRILPQVLLSAKVKNEDKAKAMEFDILQSAIDKYEKQLDGKGRILVRASGTEPIIRVMIEGENEEEISQMARDLVAIIQKNFIV